MRVSLLLERAEISDVIIVRPIPQADHRGLFARVFCQEAFAASGVAFLPLQMSVSFNDRAGTLRGLHWQDNPHAEAKLVRVTRGAVYDVAVDVRSGSPTFCRWFGLELSSENRLSLYIPPGFAHGFCALSDEAEVIYKCTDVYHPAGERTIVWNDPQLAIPWPANEPFLAEKDKRGLRFANAPYFA